MKRLIFVSLAFLLISGCSTLNAFRSLKPNYAALPEKALREAAQQIERDVAKGNRDLSLKDQEGLKLNTPEIAQAVRTRAARAVLVSKLLDSGFAWERKNGLISVLRSSAYKKATTAQERDTNALLVMNENQNRWTLFEGIVRENKLSSDALSGIQRIFFEARKSVMAPAQKFEDEEGKAAAK